MRKVSLLRRLALGLLVAGAASAAPEPSGFSTAFERHLKGGDLLDSRTAAEFAARGWGTLYRDAVAAQFPGASAAGIRLEIALAPGYTPEVGRSASLVFRVKNEGDRPVTV